MVFNEKDNDSKQRFGIRKLTIGACSVLLSTIILGISTQGETYRAQAATVDSSLNSSIVNPIDNTQNKNNYSTSSETNSVNEKKESVFVKDTQNSSQENNDKVSTSVSATENNKLNSAINPTESALEEKNSTQAENLKTNDENENIVDSNKENNVEKNVKAQTEENTQKSEVQKDSIDVEKANKTVDTANIENTSDSSSVKSDADDLDLNKVTDQSSANKLEETVDSSNLRASNISRVRALTASTTANLAEADEIKASAAVTIPSNDGRYTLYISRNTWGNTTDGNQPAKVLLSGNVSAGDNVSISIPSYGIVGVTQPTIDANYGSASIDTVGNDKVVTYNFTTSGVINPIITIDPDNGYGAKPQPMQITQPTVKDITWTINGVEQTSAEFHIDVNPVWNPKFSLSKPDPTSTDPNVLKKMIPNYESIYQLAINETNGVAPGQDYSSNAPYPSPKINSAVNYGTVITIPMPKGYVLDESATMQLNKFGDKTTITQEGDNVIITVPKGSGTQGYSSGSAYQLVGSYNIALPTTATTYTADAPITIVQKLNDDGSQTKTWNGPTVSQDFYGANDQIPLGQIPLYAKAAYNGNQLLNNGHKQIVAYFGITNESIASYNDYNSKLTFNFDEGLGVTELKTPTIPGTNNYKYIITYADGTTSEGQVSAGEIITGTGVITNIVVSPDDFERDQSTAINLPTNNFANQTTESVNAFEAYGAVPNSVKPGTQLVANMTFTGTIQQGNVTRYLTSTTQFGQNVVSSADLTSSSGIFGYQTNTATGQPNVGYLSVYAGGGQTNNIYEPIFYYVLPEWFSVYDFSTDYTKLPNFVPNTNNGVTGAPKLSVFTVPTETPGLSRQVVKIDYSGTGYNFLAGQGANNQIHLNSLPDGTNGTYQGMIYIVSPTTKLTNTAYNPDNTSNFAPNGITFNPDWVQGNTSNLYYVGSKGFNINQVGGANTASVAQGNQNNILVDSGVSNLYDSSEMVYAIRLINASGSNLTNVVALVNLPQASDTSFTFQLSGRPVYDGDKTGYTFLYSTKLGDLKKNSDPDGTKPDETGYVPADQVTDWSKIKSIIIKVAALGNNERSDRLIFTGTDPNLVNDAGKTGYISTGFYSDTTKPFISSEAVYNASTAPNKVKPANITVTGAANINFKLQYTDENGQVQTVDLPNLSTSYNLAQNNTMLTEQEAIDLANKNAASSIPANYEIKSATLQSGGKTWQTDAPAGTPVFGGNVQYFYNNATVILQAVPIQRTLTYQVIDENDPSNPTTIQSNTDLLSNGQAITGNQGSTVPADATTAYNAVKSALEKQGYVISSNSSTVPETFGPDNTELTIYVTHKTIQVSNPDQWPSTSTDADKVSLSETITRTIDVSGLPTPVASIEQNVNFTRTAVVDEVTGKIVGYVDPSDSTKTITDGNAVWASTNDKWDAFVPANIPAGYSIASITDANGNYPDVTSVDGKLTGVAPTTVSANGSNVKVTITYQSDEVSNTITFIDTDDNNKQVGATITINGRVGETDSNLNLTVPDGYELANGASLPTSYTFEATNTPITIPLVHKHKTVGPDDTWPSTSTDADKVSLSETITRTIDVSGLPIPPIASVEQNVNFTRTAVVDEVTGKVIGYVDPSDSTKAITDGNAAWTSTNANWSSWTNSNVPEGYYIESAKVGNDNYTDVTNDANGIITGLNSVAVTPEKSSITVNVVYNKVSLDLSINHNPIINTYNGSEQPVSDNIIGEITHTAISSNTNVPVTTIAQAIKNANLTSDDYSYTDAQGNVLTGIPTNAGDYHIILNQNGLDKLNKVAGGLTVNYDPSKSYVNYTIEKAQATAKLEGNNSKTYDAKAVTNIEVTKDGNIKVAANVPGATQAAYELQTNDYDWYNEDGSTKLSSAPTNVGKYTIKLNRAGMENIKMHYGNSENINWVDDAITGSATYEITKAIPGASFTGQGEKTYDGTPIAGYAPSLTITAPGSHDVALVAGTDYVWTKDGQAFTTAPTDAGDYTVSLTSDGIAKIKAKNAANLDWSNVMINENASYTINKAQATVNFDQPASQTVEYGKNTFDINNFKPSISTNNQVTVDVPDGVTLSVTDGDFEFTAANGDKTTTVPTELGTYTVTLSEIGFKKLQSQTNNYNWINGASGTYTVNKATNVSVVLDGYQEATYTGNTFTNNDINVDDYQVTLGNGQTYQLVAGDLEFVPNQDPTNVSSYKVQLSEQGKKNIAKVNSIRYSYNFDNTGTGSFEIQKAIPSVEFNASAEKIFDGAPIALENYATKPSVTVAAPGKPTITLEAGDYVWVKDGITYTTAPSNVGNYIVQLSESGKNKILQNSDNAENIDWTDAKISGEGSYVITEAKASADLSGNSFKMYDGKPVTTAEINAKNGTVEVTITIPNSHETVIYKLQTGDYTWNTPNVDAPTDVGSYTLSLSETGLTNLQSAIDGKWGKGNVKITDNDLKGEATFTINRPNITISGEHDQTETYTGNPQVIDPNTFPITLKPDGDGPVPTIPDGTLTSGDFVVKDKDGKPVDPTDVGDYTVYLTPDGVEKLKKLNPNYNWPTTDQKVGTLTVTPASMNVTLAGNDSKVSDGRSANVALSTLLDNLTGKKLNKDELTLDDFTWNTPDGKAPNEVGNYTITLNENGLKKLQDNNPNYTVKVTGEFKYIITAASQKIEYVDSNGNVIKTIDNIGTDSSNYGDKVDFDVKKNLPKDYKLVDSNVPAQITIKNSVTKFLVEPDIVTTTETKTVTRTIIVENPGGSETQVKQTVTFTRPKYTDPVNGEVTYGNWDKSSGSWEKYSAPAIPGYTSNEVAGEEVTPNTEDKTVTVKYTKNPAIETTETKTVTRTIIVENPDGSENQVKQTVTFTRPKYTDPVNGEVTYGDWDKSSGSWDKYSAPELPGYTSNEVAEEKVTPDTEDKVVRITYSKQQKLEPERPMIPSKNEDDKKSEKMPQTESLVSNKKPHTVQKNVGKEGKQVMQGNQRNDHTLPQTGAHKEMLAIVSGALAIGIGLLGLSSNRKKKK